MWWRTAVVCPISVYDVLNTSLNCWSNLLPCSSCSSTRIHCSGIAIPTCLLYNATYGESSDPWWLRHCTIPCVLSVWTVEVIFYLVPVVRHRGQLVMWRCAERQSWYLQVSQCQLPKEQGNRLLQQFRDVFSTSDTDIGHTTAVRHHIDLVESTHWLKFTQDGVWWNGNGSGSDIAYVDWN
jgi:hypothetical protein